jgi:hypothetical protein
MGDGVIGNTVARQDTQFWSTDGVQLTHSSNQRLWSIPIRAVMLGLGSHKPTWLYARVGHSLTEQKDQTGETRSRGHHLVPVAAPTIEDTS